MNEIDRLALESRSLENQLLTPWDIHVRFRAKLEALSDPMGTFDRCSR